MAKERVIVAQYDGPGKLLWVAEQMRDAGYKKFDCHSPFPIHGMDNAMGIGRSKLGFIVGIFAFLGFSFAVWLQWWVGVKAYPLVISGKPLFSYPAYLPVTFSLAVLFSAISAVLSMLVLNKLPRWNHPLFDSEIFKKIGDDGFFVSVDSDDPQFDPVRTRQFLESIGAEAVEIV